MNDKDRYIGTRDDDTMTIEGEGSTQVSYVNEIPERVSQSVGVTGNPCDRFGHNPKYIHDDAGQVREVEPRVCRHCGQLY